MSMKSRPSPTNASSTANEAAFPLGIKPSRCLSIWNDRSDWRARCLLPAAALTALSALTASSAAWPVLLPLPAASTLVSGASSVVAVIAVAGVPLRLVPFAGLTAAGVLRIVLSLRRSVAVWWRGRVGIRIHVRSGRWCRRRSGKCW